MQHDKFDKKVRFSYFLPYGLVSPLALELSINLPSYAYAEYDPVLTMEQRLDGCRKAHNRRLTALRKMLQYGYCEEVVLKYGSLHWEEIRLYRLTRAGVYLLTNTPDHEVEQERRKNAGQAGRKKSYVQMDEDSVTKREEFYAQGVMAAYSEEAANLFRETLLEVIEDNTVTVLAAGTADAPNIQVPSRLKGNQLYRAWRQTNIEALFRANRYLTSIDRRQVSFPEKTELPEQPYEMGDFVKHTLARWYGNHPDSYQFIYPEPNDSSEARNYWASLPAFYSASEIPGFQAAMDTLKRERKINPRGANNTMGNSFAGVACGKIDYIVYHTKPGKTPWSTTMETMTALAVKRALTMYRNGTNCSDENAASEALEIDITDTIENAIMVCPTVHQFASLFSYAKAHMATQDKKRSIVGKPYKSVFIVPLNHSGVMQLRCLMYAEPEAFEETLVRSFLAQEGFSARPVSKSEKENIFRLSYGKRPVLLAHMMDFQKLYWAMEYYHSGKPMYVSCYPEQVKFIQKIMPEVDFL